MKKIFLTTLMVLSGSIITLPTLLEAMEKKSTETTLTVVNTSKKPIKIMYTLITPDNKEERGEHKIGAGQRFPLELEDKSLLYQMSVQFEHSPTSSEIDMQDLFDLSKPEADGKMYLKESKKDENSVQYELEIAGKKIEARGETGVKSFHKPMTYGYRLFDFQIIPTTIHIFNRSSKPLEITYTYEFTSLLMFASTKPETNVKLVQPGEKFDLPKRRLNRIIEMAIKPEGSSESESLKLTEKEIFALETANVFIFVNDTPTKNKITFTFIARPITLLINFSEKPVEVTTIKAVKAIKRQRELSTKEIHTIPSQGYLMIKHRRLNPVSEISLRFSPNGRSEELTPEEISALTHSSGNIFIKENKEGLLDYEVAVAGEKQPEAKLEQLAPETQSDIQKQEFELESQEPDIQEVTKKEQERPAAIRKPLAEVAMAKKGIDK